MPKPFERGDLGALDRFHRRDAGSHRLPFDDHRAGSALAEAAAELGTVQFQIVAQDVEQRRRRIEVQRMARPLTLRVIAMSSMILDQLGLH